VAFALAGTSPPITSFLSSMKTDGGSGTFTEFLVLLLTKTADFSTKFINPRDWEEFVVELGQ
jgi:hypothetical protein